MGLSAYSPFLLSCSLWVGLVAGLWWESRRLERNREKIPLRIHVNGTRGKSSVTRLIAAGLRAGGYTVLAKTTGTSPRLIRPDGSEEPWTRRGPANIRENMAFLRRAALVGADAVVVECMALRPDLQRTLEHRILKSHLGVLTNIRLDHEDIMGKGLDAVARALSETIPQDGTLVATGESLRKLRQAGVGIRDSALHLASEKLPEACLAHFPFEVFAENVALALTVCKSCGVTEAAALEGMHRSAPDDGAVCVHRFALGNRTVHFIDALAANDPESTMLLWQRYRDPKAGAAIILLNPRADRKFRTRQLCLALGALHQGLFLVTGESRLVRSQLRRFTGVEIVSTTRKDCLAVLQKVIAETPNGFVQVFAAGNRQGMEPLLAKLATLEKQSGTA